MAPFGLLRIFHLALQLLAVVFWMWLSQIVCAWLFLTAAAKQKKDLEEHQLSLLSSPYYSRLVEFVTELTSSIEVSDIKTAPSPFRAQLMP